MARQLEKKYLKLFETFLLETGLSQDEDLRQAVFDSRLIPNLSLTHKMALAPKELLCLILLSQGRDSAECAHLLRISKTTLKTYELRFRQKLKAVDRTHAFYQALRKKFLLFRED